METLIWGNQPSKINISMYTVQSVPTFFDNCQFYTNLEHLWCCDQEIICMHKQYQYT